MYDTIIGRKTYGPQAGNNTAPGQSMTTFDLVLIAAAALALATPILLSFVRV